MDFNRTHSRTLGLDKELSDKIEFDYKKIISAGYTCMRFCYEKEDSDEDPEICAGKCEASIKRGQNEIRDTLNLIKKQLTKCVRKCDGVSNEKMEECLDGCIDNFRKNTVIAKSITEGIVRDMDNIL